MTFNRQKTIAITVSALCALPPFAMANESEAFLNDPKRMLQYHLQNYQTVQLCYEARQDLAFQYTTKKDLDKARVSIRKIDESMTTKTPNLDIEAVWKKALSEFGDPKTMPAGYRNDPISKTHIRLHRDILVGQTGKDRRIFFSDRVRNATAKLSKEAIQFVCSVAFLNLQSAADYLTDKDSSAPKKDY